MAESELEYLRGKLKRLITARDNGIEHTAVRSEFNKLIRSVRSKIRRLEKKK